MQNEVIQIKISKNIRVLLCSISTITLLLSIGCSNLSEPIKIGVVGTMTGINSDLSVSGRRGVELAVSELNSSGGVKGRKVELDVKDDQNDPAVALRVDKEFVDQNIPVVIGHYTSGMMLSSIDYLRETDQLILAPTVSADSLSGIDDNFIRFIATTREQAVVLADKAKKNNHKNFAVIYDLSNKGFNDDLYNNFKKMLEQDQGKIILTQTFTAHIDLDGASLVNTVAESKADALFIMANAEDNAKISQQLRKIGCNVQTYSPLWSNTDELIKKGGTAVEGAFLVGAIDINDRSDGFTKFKEDYLRKYGDNPNFSSVYSYETAVVLFQAMKMGPNLNPATLKKNIIKIRDFKGLQEDFQIDKFGDNDRTYQMFKIENGELRKVD